MMPRHYVTIALPVDLPEADQPLDGRGLAEALFKILSLATAHAERRGFELADVRVGLPLELYHTARYVHAGNAADSALDIALRHAGLRLSQVTPQRGYAERLAIAEAVRDVARATGGPDCRRWLRFADEIRAGMHGTITPELDIEETK